MLNTMISRTWVCFALGKVGVLYKAVLWGLEASELRIQGFRDAFFGVLVGGSDLRYQNTETMLFIVDPHFGNLNKIP